MRTSKLLLLLLPLLVSLAACRLPESDDLQIVWRWTAEDPRASFSADGVRDVEVVFSWTFESAEDLAAWDTSGDAGNSLELRQSSAVLTWTRKRPRLLHAADFEAGSIDAIEVVAPDLDKGELRLLWSGEGQRFARERSLALSARKPHAAPSETYLFELAGHPEWIGRIRHLGLDFIVPAPPARLAAVRGLRYSISLESLQQAARRPWKIDLGHDVRDALLAVPEAPLERRLEVPGGAVLRLAYGATPDLGAPVRFLVLAASGPGEPQVLFEGTVAPSAGQRTGRWHEAEVDLSAFSGRSARLRLETETASPKTDGLAFWASPKVLAPPATPAPPNVVLIVVDTLRADRLSLYGYDRQTTPRIDAWARRRAVTFHNAVAPAPWTLPSHISLFTGLDALHHGFNHGSSSLPAGGTLADLLRAAGYATLAITGGGYLHPQYGLQQGFDRFLYWPSERAQSEELESGIERALEWLDAARDRPFFLFFHTYETHSPFLPRQPFFDDLAPEPALARLADRITSGRLPAAAAEGFLQRRRYLLRKPGAERGKEPLPDDLLPVVSALYDSGVAYADDHVGRLLARLENPDLGRRTLVILTSDHGEALGEKGLAAHAYLYDFNLLVPLVVAFPDGAGAGRSIERQVRLIDVLPTVLECAGAAAPEGVDGTSLTPLVDDPEAAFPRHAWAYASSSNFGLALRVANRLKYIFNNSAAGPIHGDAELYDLVADPAERADVAAQRPAEAGRLRAAVNRRYEVDFQGLRIELANAGKTPYRVRLTGRQFLTPTRIKATDLPGRVASWQGAGRLDVRVPAASRFSLFLEAVAAGKTLEIEAAGPGIALGCRESFETSLLETPSQMVIDPTACTTHRGPADAPATGISLLWKRPLADLEPAHRFDPQLQRQLEALGYVD